MPDALDPLHPQDKRGWLYGDPVAIDDPNVAYDLGVERGTLLPAGASLRNTICATSKTSACHDYRL